LKKNIVLLDIDGVLVYPGGYRNAINSSMMYILDRMSIGYSIHDDIVPILYESVGITSEWDMLPLLMASVLDSFLARHGNNYKLGSLEQASELLSRLNIGNLSVDYKLYIKKLTSSLAYGKNFSSTLLHDILIGKFENPFTQLGGHPIIYDLFSHSRDIKKSFLTKLFQNIVLGDELFCEVYKIDPVMATPPFLEKYDVPLLQETTKDKLYLYIKDGLINASVYTARPSYPPIELHERIVGYSPEAEMALSINGITDIPLIGYGKIAFLAEQKGINPEFLLKPNPFQAIAAIFAALTGNEIDSLDIAYNLTNYTKKGDFNLFFEKFRDQDYIVHVFEDTPGGVIALREACKILSDLGINLALIPYGVSKNKEKIGALKKLDIPIYKDINLALEKLFSIL